MLEKYGTGDRPKVCPGESECSRFQSAAGKAHAAKVRNACSGCELLSTKRSGKANERLLTEITNDVMAMRYEHLAGYPRPVTKMTAVHFEALPILEALFEREERQIRKDVRFAIFALAGVKER